MSRKKSALGLFFHLSVRVRKIRGILTQVEFAKILGVTQGTINKYERGGILPGEDILKKIAEFGGVTVEWLLHGDPAAPQITEHAPEIYDARPLAPLDFPKLIQVVAAVEDYYTAHRLKRRSIQKARLIALLYEHCTDNKENPDEILVKRYLPLAD